MKADGHCFGYRDIDPFMDTEILFAAHQLPGTFAPRALLLHRAFRLCRFGAIAKVRDDSAARFIQICTDKIGRNTFSNLSTILQKSTFGDKSFQTRGITAKSWKKLEMKVIDSAIAHRVIGSCKT